MWLDNILIIVFLILDFFSSFETSADGAVGALLLKKKKQGINVSAIYRQTKFNLLTNSFPSLIDSSIYSLESSNS